MCWGNKRETHKTIREQKTVCNQVLNCRKLWIYREETLSSGSFKQGCGAVGLVRFLQLIKGKLLHLVCLNAALKGPGLSVQMMRKCHHFFPGGTNGKESTYQCRRQKRCRSDPCVRKIPWRRTWQSSLVFLLENPMDRGAWWSIGSIGSHRVRHNWSDLTCTHVYL